MPIEQLKSDLARLQREIDALESGKTDSVQDLQALAERVQQELDEQNGVADPAALVEELEDVVSTVRGKPSGPRCPLEQSDFTAWQHRRVSVVSADDRLQLLRDDITRLAL